MTLLPSMFFASRATASGARRHGFDENMPNIAVRPTAVFAIRGSTGFNARPIPTQNPDKDGYRSTSANARLGFRINERHRLDATLLANE